MLTTTPKFIFIHLTYIWTSFIMNPVWKLETKVIAFNFYGFKYKFKDEAMNFRVFWDHTHKKILKGT